MKPGMYYDIPKGDYHALAPNPKEHYYSSSQLKKMLEDEELFYRLYISRTEKASDKDEAHFDIGTVFHAAILEPHTLKDIYVEWKGGNRQGEMWNRFKALHKGKIILSTKENNEVINAVEAVESNPLAMALIDHPETRNEVAIFVMLHGVRVKVCWDFLALMPKGGGVPSFGGDLKSVSKSCRSTFALGSSITDGDYRLSCGLYVDAANQWIKDTGNKYEPVEDWYWIFSSKKHKNSQVVKAGELDLKIGRNQYKKAIDKFKENTRDGWEFVPKIIEIPPHKWEIDTWCPDEKVEVVTANPDSEDGI